jgi:hypothetical protein
MDMDIGWSGGCCHCWSRNRWKRRKLSQHGNSGHVFHHFDWNTDSQLGATMNLIRFLLLAFLTCEISSAQIERPQIAWLLDGQNRLRPITGTAAAATVGDPVAQGVLSLACFPEVCFAKMNAAVYSSTGWGAAAPEGPAMFATANGTAYLYFYETQQFAKWTGGDLVYLLFSPGGEILSIRATGDGFDYAVARDDGTWVEHFSENDLSVAVLGPLGDTGAVLLLDSPTAMDAPAVDLALVAASDSVHLVRIDGTRDFRFDSLGVADVDSMFPVGNGYVQINTPRGVWLFRMTSTCDGDTCERLGSYELILLPPAPPPPPASANSDSPMEDAQ